LRCLWRRSGTPIRGRDRATTRVDSGHRIFGCRARNGALRWAITTRWRGCDVGQAAEACPPRRQQVVMSMARPEADWRDLVGVDQVAARRRIPPGCTALSSEAARRRPAAWRSAGRSTSSRAAKGATGSIDLRRRAPRCAPRDRRARAPSLNRRNLGATSRRPAPEPGEPTARHVRQGLEGSSARRRPPGGLILWPG
jgi:hypothetical protein